MRTRYEERNNQITHDDQTRCEERYPQGRPRANAVAKIFVNCTKADTRSVCDTARHWVPLVRHLRNGNNFAGSAALAEVCALLSAILQLLLLSWEACGACDVYRPGDAAEADRVPQHHLRRPTSSEGGPVASRTSRRRRQLGQFGRHPATRSYTASQQQS